MPPPPAEGIGVDAFRKYYCNAAKTPTLSSTMPMCLQHCLMCLCCIKKCVKPPGPAPQRALLLPHGHAGRPPMLLPLAVAGGKEAIVYVIILQQQHLL